MDRVTTTVRSAIMSAVKQKNTGPEILVRQCLHRMGFRFRLHVNSMPGKPDIVLPKYRVVVFVHGCFWHGHPECSKSRRPSGNADYWNAKLDRNIERDANTLAEVRARGWDCLVVWQCELRNQEELAGKLQAFLQAHAGNNQVST